MRPTRTSAEVLYRAAIRGTAGYAPADYANTQPEYVLNRPCFTPRMYPRDTFSSISRSKNSFAINSAFTASRASPPQAAIA